MALRPLDPDARLRLSSKARLRWDEREQKHLLLYPERGLLLNATAGAVVKLLDGTRPLAEVARAVIEATPGAEQETVERDVAELIERLRERGLVEVAP